MQIQRTINQPVKSAVAPAPQSQEQEQQPQEPVDSWVREASGIAGGVGLGMASFFAVGRAAGAIARAISPPSNALDLADLTVAVVAGSVAGVGGIVAGNHLGFMAYDKLTQ